jgi:hypothetical protein
MDGGGGLIWVGLLRAGSAPAFFEKPFELGEVRLAIETFLDHFAGLPRQALAKIGIGQQ